MIKKITKALLIIDIVLLNIGFLAFLYQNVINKDLFRGLKQNENNEAESLPISNSFLQCGDNCRAYIDSLVAQKIGSQSSSTKVSSTPTPYPTKTAVVAPAKSKRVSYIPVPGSGNTLQTSWTDLSGTDFYFTKGDYPGFTEAYFEANMKLLNGNGSAYLRLFDVTNGVGVVGSEISTSSQTTVFVSSGKMSLYDGYNLYRVQARSLTSDTTSFESGRLKIITLE